MKILTTSKSLTQLITNLNSSDKVYYVRFGDADVLLVEGVKFKRPIGKNGTVQTPELTKELRESLQINNPLYLRGVSGVYPTEPGMVDGLFAPFSNKDNLERILYQQTNSRTFFSPVLFHYLGVFKPKILKNFISKYIKDRPKMFIGCCSQENMEKFFGKIDIHVKTPLTNSYGAIDKWWPKVERHYKDVKVVLACTGQASRVVAKRLWNLNANVHCLDFGSIVAAIDNDPHHSRRTCWKMEGGNVRRFFVGE